MQALETSNLTLVASTRIPVRTKPFNAAEFQQRPGVDVSIHLLFDKTMTMLGEPTELLVPSSGERSYVAYAIDPRKCDELYERGEGEILSCTVYLDKELVGRPPSTLEEIDALMDAQPNGEEGFLSNEHMTTFKVRAQNQEGCVVDVFWDSGRHFWRVSCSFEDSSHIEDWGGSDNRFACPETA